MIKRNSWQALALAATLFAGGAGGVGAQERRPAGQEERQQRVEQELIFTRQHPETGFRVPVPSDTFLSTPLPGDTFTFLATEMSFDGKIVKGAPYSAEAVTETVQVLADGNRITRKNTSQIYRDAEGRTRREQTLAVLGPWTASSDEPPRTISINDPVAGFSYSLDPRTRTARKIKVMQRRSAASAVTLNSGKLEVLPLDGKPINIAEMKSTLPGRVVNRAAAAHPANDPVRGAVIVKIKVNAAGAVESAEAIIGAEAVALRDAALEAARGWTFKPGEAETAAIQYKFDGRATVQGELLRVFETSKKEDKDGAKKSERHVMIVTGDSPNVETQSLGKQFVEGVEAEGTRTVRTIPAGQIGNEQPIQIVNERWYSPELQVVMMTRNSDPRTGETTYRLTNISRTEPAASLFQVPADYTVKEGPTPFIRGMRATPAPLAPASPMPF